jgi:hypothetical protein
MNKILLGTVLLGCLQMTACSSTDTASGELSDQELRAEVQQMKKQLDKLNRLEPGLKRMVAMESDLKGLITQLNEIAGQDDYALQPAEEGDNVKSATIERVSFEETTGQALQQPVQTAVVEPVAEPEPAEQVNSTQPEPVLETARQSIQKKYSLQLASIKDEKSLDKTWSSIKAKHSDLMEDWSPKFESAVVANVTYFRVKAGEFDSYESANSSCKQVRLHGTNCIVSKIEVE